VLRERKRGTLVFISGTTLCYSMSFKAGPHNALPDLLNMDPCPIWPDLISPHGGSTPMHLTGWS
jgi:hypothetical protein